MAVYLQYLPSGRMFKDGVEFPLSYADPVFQEYIAWQMAGNGPETQPDPIDPTPRITVTAWQMMQVLLQNNMDEAVETAVMGSGDRTLIAGYRFANEWNSDCPVLVGNLALFGLSEAQCYDLFVQAAAIAVQESQLSVMAVL